MFELTAESTRSSSRARKAENLTSRVVTNARTALPRGKETVRSSKENIMSFSKIIETHILPIKKESPSFEPEKEPLVPIVEPEKEPLDLSLASQSSA